MLGIWVAFFYECQQQSCGQEDHIDSAMLHALLSTAAEFSIVVDSAEQIKVRAVANIANAAMCAAIWG